MNYDASWMREEKEEEREKKKEEEEDVTSLASQFAPFVCIIESLLYSTANMLL